MFYPLKRPVYECCVFFYFSVLAPRPVCSVRDHCFWPGSLSVACVCNPFHGRLQLAKIPCWLVARRPAHQPDGSCSILRGGTLPSAPVLGRESSPWVSLIPWTFFFSSFKNCSMALSGGMSLACKIPPLCYSLSLEIIRHLLFSSRSWMGTELFCWTLPCVRSPMLC